MQGGANNMRALLTLKSTEQLYIWHKWNEEVWSEYTPVEENQDKKHEIHQIETIINLIQLNVKGKIGNCGNLIYTCKMCFKFGPMFTSFSI